MKVEGLTVTADWDGTTLRARGRNGPAHRKFARDIAHEGDVLIPRNRVVRAWMRPATRMTNGLLGVRTDDGRTFEIQFRRKQAEGFDRVARDLGADV